MSTVKKLAPTMEAANAKNSKIIESLETEQKRYKNLSISALANLTICQAAIIKDPEKSKDFVLSATLEREKMTTFDLHVLNLCNQLEASRNNHEAALIETKGAHLYDACADLANDALEKFKQLEEAELEHGGFIYPLLRDKKEGLETARVKLFRYVKEKGLLSEFIFKLPRNGQMHVPFECIIGANAPLELNHQTTQFTINSSFSVRDELFEEIINHRAPFFDEMNKRGLDISPLWGYEISLKDA